MVNDIIFGRDNYCAEDSSLMMVMMHFGFDFSLVGSEYLYRMLCAIIEDRSVFRWHSITALPVLAERYNCKGKSMNRAIRWSIARAFKDGLLKYVPCFQELDRLPSTKQVLSWLYGFYVNQFVYL